MELGMRLAAGGRGVGVPLAAWWAMREMPGVRNAGCAGAASRSRCLGLGCAEA